MDANAPAEEIRACLTVADREALPVAIETLRAALRPCRKGQEQETLAMALARQIGLLKMNSLPEQKEEWIALAMDELVDQPCSLVMDALADVRHRIRFEGEVVPTVIEIVEPRAARLRNELRLVERLAEVAA